MFLLRTQIGVLPRAARHTPAVAKQKTTTTKKAPRQVKSPLASVMNNAQQKQFELDMSKSASYKLKYRFGLVVVDACKRRRCLKFVLHVARARVFQLTDH